MRFLAHACLAAITPLAITAGCGDNLLPTEEAEDLQTDALLPPAVPRALEGFIEFSNPICDRVALGYAAMIRYADGSPVENLQCRYTFADGGTSDSCTGVHEFAAGYPGGTTYETTLHVSDGLGTELVLTHDAPVYAPIDLIVYAEAPACGLELSVGHQNSSSVTNIFGTIDPLENVIVDFDGSPSITAGTFAVTEPGTYTVTITAEQERSGGPLCTQTVSKSVEVHACNEPDHEHTPGCGH